MRYSVAKMVSFVCQVLMPKCWMNHHLSNHGHLESIVTLDIQSIGYLPFSSLLSQNMFRIVFHAVPFKSTYMA